MADTSQTRCLVFKTSKGEREQPKWVELRLPYPRGRAATYGGKGAVECALRVAGYPHPPELNNWKKIRGRIHRLCALGEHREPAQFLLLTALESQPEIADFICRPS
jgi:hypothetical protein